MSLSAPKRTLQGGGALFVLAGLGMFCFHSSNSEQAVELERKSHTHEKSDISKLISSMTGSIESSKYSDAALHPVASLSRNDYTLSQMKEVAKRIRLAEQTEQVGYLRRGDSLPGMPLRFNEGTDKVHGHYTVGGQCGDACLQSAQCKAYTYLTVTGECYLKTAVKPGLNHDNTCDPTSCWYFGVISDKH